MSAALLAWSLIVAQIALVLAMGCAAIRILVGPRAQDRVVAFDALYVNAMLLLLCVGIRTGTPLYFEAALMIAFVSSNAAGLNISGTIGSTSMPMLKSRSTVKIFAESDSGAE